MKSATLVSFLALGALGALTSPTRAQSDADRTAELEKRRDAKLAEDWIELAHWVTDLDEAEKRAKTDDKIFFAYFTRSYEP